MKSFVQLIENLDATNKTSGKIKALVDFFTHCETPSDKLWALALLSSRAGKRTVRTSDLREFCIEMTGFEPWLFEETYHIVGDLAETIAKLLPEGSSDNKISLTHWMTWIESLKADEVEVKKQKIQSAWSQLNGKERFVFNKMILGGFRIGVSQKLVIKALAKIYQYEESEISHRLMGNWTPKNTSWEALIENQNPTLDLSKPYPFFLAYPIEDSFFEKEDPNDWAAEHKWDGIRGQAIKRKGEVYLWSRGEELVNPQFPELLEAISTLPDGTVLDGVIIPFKNGEIASFNTLQNRLGRKLVSKKLLQDNPVAFRIYDILEFNGSDLRTKTWVDRRNLLEKISSDFDDHTLQISEYLTFKNWDELKEERDQARNVKSEGLMLKRKNSEYGVGRTKGSWWKWKLDPLTIDAVMIYAMRGHGNRANLYTDYTFALWDGDSLVPFTKAYSGLTNKEIEEVDAFVKKNTIEKFGPVRSVKAELVFEIAFEGIQESKRHKSGVALRFPRIHRWRLDKKANEANTLQDLKMLMESYG